MTTVTRPERQASNDNSAADGGRNSSNGGNSGHNAGLNDWEYANTLAATASGRSGNMPIAIPTNFNNAPAADNAPRVCAGDLTGEYRRFSSAESTADETEVTRRLSRDTLATEASYLSSSSPRGSYNDGFGAGADGELMNMLAAHHLQGGVTLGMGGDGGQTHNPMVGGGMLFGSGPGDLNLSGLSRSAPPNCHHSMAGLRGEPFVPPKPKRQRNKQTFAMKLWNLLESPNECGGALRWMPNGASFCVVDPDELVKKVLPRYFKEAKYTSFVSCCTVWDGRAFEFLVGLTRSLFLLPPRRPGSSIDGASSISPSRLTQVKPPATWPCTPTPASDGTTTRPSARWTAVTGAGRGGTATRTSRRWTSPCRWRPTAARASGWPTRRSTRPAP